MEPERLQKVIQKIDALNSEDPNKEIIDGGTFPRELVYSQRLTEWVLKLDPDASEELKIAAHGQHIQRWKIPRSKYELNRGGYLRWREELKRFHSQQIREIMHEAGYPEVTIQKVSQIILKKNLQNDHNSQTIEDALCLVFLETQFSDVRKQVTEEKMQEIVRKTWCKMSPKAQAIALTLDLNRKDKEFIKKTLA